MCIRQNTEWQRQQDFVGFRGAQNYIALLGTCTATLAFPRAVSLMRLLTPNTGHIPYRKRYVGSFTIHHVYK